MLIFARNETKIMLHKFQLIAEMFVLPCIRIAMKKYALVGQKVGQKV
jgi:hypothetical protein